MAYNLSERFSKAEKNLPILDPGSYQNINSLFIRPNKVPFLAKCPRNTEPANKIWTHAIYNCSINKKIPNCTSIISKVPRFAYENLNNYEEEDEICQSHGNEQCKCPINNESVVATDVKNEICQAKLQRRIFKGSILRSLLDERLSGPSRKDFGFEILADGTKVRIFKQVKQDSPPFYDARNIESNAYYRGCKWSKRTSQRCDTIVEYTPGPADYDVSEKIPTDESICGEKLRALKRKTNEQLRFLDKIYRQNLLEAHPGPASYSLPKPTGTNLKFVGSKAKRFPSLPLKDSPGPTSYFIKRDLDNADTSHKLCLVRLQSRAPFGVRDRRFKYKYKEGPSPASYVLNNIKSHVKYCNISPFGSSSQRFKDAFERIALNKNDRSITSVNVKDSQYICQTAKLRHLSTWEFRSKTFRMKPLVKKTNEPSPADLPQPTVKNKRLLQCQYTCPFFSSETRFQHWYNWIPVQGSESTQGPAYYKPEKYKCELNVKNGTFSRSQRFMSCTNDIPAPNTYRNTIGIENILSTSSKRLKDNIANKRVFSWKSRVEENKVSLEDQELNLLNKSIALLEVPDIFTHENYKSEKVKSKADVIEKKPNQKLLHYFMYAHQVKRYF